MAVKTVSIVSTSVSERSRAAFIALFLGAFFILGVGFAGSETLHDVAHDTRHSYGFPCH